MTDSKGTKLAAMAWTAALLVGGVALLAQAPAGAGAAQHEGSLTLDVSVRPKSGNGMAPEIKQADMTVLDNKKPVAISSFRVMHKGDEPMRMILVLDVLDLPPDDLPGTREKLDRFLRSHDGVLPMDTALAVITGRGMQMGAFTKSGNELADLIKKAGPNMRGFGGDDEVNHGPGGHMSGGGGTQRVLGSLEKWTDDANKAQGRTIVVMLTQGWSLAFGPSLQLTDAQREGLLEEAAAFVTQMRRGKLTLYVLDPIDNDKFDSNKMDYLSYVHGPAGMKEAAPAFLGIQILGMHSGGFVRMGSDIGKAMDEVYAELDRYYEVTVPAETSPKPFTPHTIEVKLAEKNLVARSPDEYFAQP